MSVRKSERTEGKLSVLLAARNLCVYTLTICKNEKSFPKNQRWLLTSKITAEAVDAFTCIRRANAVYAKDGQMSDVDYNYRRSQQIEAHGHIHALLSLIDVAYEMNNIDSNRIAHWTALAVDTDSKLTTWARSDSKRFNK